MLRRTLVTILFLLTLVVPAQAQLGLPPHSFVADTTILAAEVNTNFSTAYSNALNRTGGTMTGLLTSQQITPASTNTYDLGTTGTRFRDLWLSRDAIIARDIGVSGSISDPDSAVTIADQLVLTSTTTPQVQFRYDGSNYFEASVSSAGAITLNAVGASAGFTFSDPVTVSGTLTATTFSGSGASLTSVPESAITDGSILARVAAAESISGLWTFSSDIIISGTAGAVNLRETGGTANEGNWRIVADADLLQIQSINDALGVGENVLRAARTGTTIDDVTIGGTQLRVADGSFSAPGIAFVNDTDTGIYRSSANVLGFTAGATTVATMDTTELFVGGAFFRIKGTLFASLGAPSNGTMTYCPDCTIANPCASGGSGAFAKRINSAWVCN